MNEAARARIAAFLAQPALARLLAALNGEGEATRVVGGAVRNLLLGEAASDIDLATTALPQETIRRGRAAGFKAVPTGIDHGTVTLVAGGTSFEVTTLRQDVETDGRRARVVFGRDFAADATRRDFTINALGLDPEGAVHDYCGGLDDLARRRVRFIGDAASRIREDYLRILRFFRFHAAYGAGEIDRAGYLACIRGRDGLATLSAERIGMEMRKLLTADGAHHAAVAMSDAGLLLAVLGGVAYPGTLAAMMANERARGLQPDAMLRLGALAVAVTEDARRLGARLRLANREIKMLDSMGHRWWRLAGMDEATAQRRLYRLGEARFRDRVMLAWARAGQHADAAYWSNLLTLPDRWPVPSFPLKADDFLVRGFAAGPALGHVLSLAEDAWLAAGFPQERSALDAIADQTAARFARDHKL